MRNLFLALALACAPIMAGCQSGILAPINGSTPQETAALAVIRGAYIVQAAYGAIGQQLDRGVITTAEATAWKAEVDKAAQAVELARVAAGAGAGDAGALIRAMDVVLLEVLRRQAAAGGV